MIYSKQNHGDDIEAWSETALNLSKLKSSAEYAQDFSKKFSKYLNKEDKIEMAGICTKIDKIYLKYWEKLVSKIRGF